MSFTVFLGNLPLWVTADDIKSWLTAENLVADNVKVIRNPETQEWQTADSYLSGAVRTKLAIAEVRAMEDEPIAYTRVQLPGIYVDRIVAVGEAR